MILTDPPYNVNVENSKGKKIMNDNMDDHSFRNFLEGVMKAAYSALKKGGAFYIWYASREVENFVASCNSAGLTIKQQLIWNKNAFVMGRQDYQWKHEPCLYGWKEGAPHYFRNSRSEATVIADKAELDFKKMKKDEALKLLKEIYAQKAATDVIDCEKPTADSEHPTMKPVKLFGYQMSNSSRPGEHVLDLFGGSGTTMIAAEQLGRKAYLMELDPHYCDVIIARWEKLTGRTAELLKA